MYKENSLETLCGLFGRSRQAYYKHKRQEIGDKEMQEKVLSIVYYYRSLMPIVSCKKLYDIVRDIMGSKLSFGRDRFMDYW